MRLKDIIWLLFLLTTEVCCQDIQETKIIPLKGMDFSGIVATSNGVSMVGFVRYVLIENPSEDQKLLIEKLVQHADSIIHEVEIAKNYSKCNVNFYKKTANTTEFINTKKNFYKAQHDLANYTDDYIGSYKMVACKGGKNLKKWVMFLNNPNKEIVIHNDCD